MRDAFQRSGFKQDSRSSGPKGSSTGKPKGPLTARAVNLKRLADALEYDLLSAALGVSETVLRNLVNDRAGPQEEHSVVHIVHKLSQAGLPATWLDQQNSRLFPENVNRIREMASSSDSKAAIRRSNLRKIVSAFQDRNELLADALELAVSTISSILNGQLEFNDQRFGHINPLLVAAGFPDGWLEQSNTTLSAEMVQGLETQATDAYERELAEAEDVRAQAHVNPEVNEAPESSLEVPAPRPEPAADIILEATASGAQQALWDTAELPHGQQISPNTTGTVPTNKEPVMAKMKQTPAPKPGARRGPAGAPAPVPSGGGRAGAIPFNPTRLAAVRASQLRGSAAPSTKAATGGVSAKSASVKGAPPPAANKRGNGASNKAAPVVATRSAPVASAKTAHAAPAKTIPAAPKAAPAAKKASPVETAHPAAKKTGKSTSRTGYVRGVTSLTPEHSQARAKALDKLLDTSRRGARVTLWRDMLGSSLPVWGNIRRGTVAFRDEFADGAERWLELPAGWLDNPKFPPATLAQWVTDPSVPLPVDASSAAVTETTATPPAAKQAAPAPTPVVAQQFPPTPRAASGSRLRGIPAPGSVAKPAAQTAAPAAAPVAATAPAAPATTARATAPGAQPAAAPAQQTLALSEPTPTHAFTWSPPTHPAPTDSPMPLTHAITGVLEKLAREGRWNDDDALRFINFLNGR
jgi:hypothetical protein